MTILGMARGTKRCRLCEIRNVTVRARRLPDRERVLCNECYTIMAVLLDERWERA